MYKNIKKLDVPIKPFYVSGLWTVSTCVIPEYDNVNFLACLSVFLCIFALTNVADIADYSEDIKYNISSLPTKLGTEITKNICLFSSLTSTYVFTQLEYFSNSIYDYIYILSNVLPYFTQ